MSAIGMTHLAMPVRDFDATMSFYRRYTELVAVQERTNEKTGLRAAWLANPGDLTATSARFVLVLLEGGHRPGAPDGSEGQFGFLTSISHLGFSVESTAEVDRLAALAVADGVLVLGPVHRSAVTGYIALLTDPDGNNVEISYGQDLG
jgi:catechol 2,3-dioxygenase-like lactoylglutathione lyase family enzyme